MDGCFFSSWMVVFKEKLLPETGITKVALSFWRRSLEDEWFDVVPG
ncbi:18028_t:CDS:2, partial [Racocetra persica]